MKVIQVKVKPRARLSQLLPMEDGSWSAQLKAPPVNGQANAELIALVAKAFACSRSAVSIKGGSTGRTKWVQIDAGD